jgi:hypothetical protein
MADTIWSIIALVGAILVIGMVAYFIATSSRLATTTRPRGSTSTLTDTGRTRRRVPD